MRLVGQREADRDVRLVDRALVGQRPRSRRPVRWAEDRQPCAGAPWRRRQRGRAEPDRAHDDVVRRRQGGRGRHEVDLRGHGAGLPQLRGRSTQTDAGSRACPASAASDRAHRAVERGRTTPAAHRPRRCDSWPGRATAAPPCADGGRRAVGGRAGRRDRAACRGSRRRRRAAALIAWARSAKTAAKSVGHRTRRASSRRRASAAADSSAVCWPRRVEVGLEASGGSARQVVHEAAHLARGRVRLVGHDGALRGQGAVRAGVVALRLARHLGQSADEERDHDHDRDEQDDGTDRLIDGARGGVACVATSPQEVSAGSCRLHREEGRVRRVVRRRERAGARAPLHGGGDGPDVHPVAVPLHQRRASR